MRSCCLAFAFSLRVHCAGERGTCDGDGLCARVSLDHFLDQKQWRCGAPLFLSFIGMVNVYVSKRAFLSTHLIRIPSVCLVLPTGKPLRSYIMHLGDSSLPSCCRRCPQPIRCWFSSFLFVFLGSVLWLKTFSYIPRESTQAPSAELRIKLYRPICAKFLQGEMERPIDEVAVHDSDSDDHAPPYDVVTDEEQVAEALRYQSLLEELSRNGLHYDPTSGQITEAFSDAKAKEDAVKEARYELERLANDVSLAEDAKKDIMPAYERAMKNVELKDRVDALKREITDEESRLKTLDQSIRTLDAELSQVTAAYKKKRDHRAAVVAKLKSSTTALLDAVLDKVRKTLQVDDEANVEFFSPADCLEFVGHLEATRERAVLTVNKQLRELNCTCEFKRDECDALRRDNAAVIEKARAVRDESIRSLVYGLQDERNRLLANIEELTTITSDQALNLKVGHVHTNARDRSRFDAGPSTKKGNTVSAAVRPAVSDTTRAPVTARKTAPRRGDEVSFELQFVAEKNKELLMEITDIKTTIHKLSANRTGAIQAAKRLQGQLKRDKEHFEATLVKLDSQIYAEQAALRAVEKDNARLADAIQQLTTVVQANKRHLEHCRTKTQPLPVE